MNNKGDHTKNTIEVGEAFSIKPKDKVIGSFNGGKSVNIKYIEPKKNKLFPFILIGIIICLIILITQMNNSAKEIKRNQPTESTTTTTETTTTTQTTTANIDNTEISNFSAYLEDIISRSDKFDSSYDETINYKGMYFKFYCSYYDYEKFKCSSGKGEMLLPGGTIPLYEFMDDKENFVEHSRQLYLSLVDDKLMVVKCFDEPGTSSYIIYDLQGRILSKKDKITTSYYDNKVLHTSLLPSFKGENSPKTIYYYSCKKSDKANQDVGSYTATISNNPTIKEQKLNLPSTAWFSCKAPKKVEQ